MIQTNYNPDVLSCLANLSNDEVFTPPNLVNDILDLLPAELWSNPNAKFLDPVSKSGVFLREMAKRLMLGLETQIPDKQERINHIFSQQLYGIAITDLTALLSRRSVYCSKTANGKYSICESFDNEQGNIRYERMKHTWRSLSGAETNKCLYCGASQEVYDREDALETYAYNFIHIPTDSAQGTNSDVERSRNDRNRNSIQNIFNMKFDVIVGNPPYQLNDGGAGVSASPLYHKFVEQAIKLSPHYLSMIIPSRWFSGGKGLDEFREEILNDSRVRQIVDYFDSNECFPGVDISGGVCYFLWDKKYKGDCSVTSIRKGNKSILDRPLLEINSKTFIRFNEAIPIIRKIKKFKEISFDTIVSSRKPFGLSTNVVIKDKKGENDISIYAYPKSGFIPKNKILKNTDWINKYKVLVAKAYGERGSFPYLMLGKPFIAENNSCCSETYIVIGPFSSKKEADNVISYIKSKFFRFLILLKKNTQDATSKVYSFVPIQDLNEVWTDEKLYKKYGLTNDEIAFIDSMIRPVDLTKNDEVDE